MIELLSVLVLTFSLTLVVLGLVTIWLERGPGRWQGVTACLLGILLGSAYGFLASRLAEALFGQLIVRVDLPVLMATAFVYAVGVLGGVSLAGGLFLWVTGRYQAWQIRRRMLALILAAVLLAIALTFLAVRISHLPT